MRYKVEDEIFDDYRDAVEYCISEDYHEDDDFEEWINDLYGSIEINGTTYWAYDIADNAGDLYDLRREFCESQNERDRDEANYELRNATPGDEIECQSYTIEVLADEGEEETGDFDGDNELLLVRQFIEEQKALKKNQVETEKKDEEDIMSLFQKIGG